VTKKKNSQKTMDTPFDLIENSTLLETYDALDDPVMANEMMTEIFITLASKSY
jgi:hypothetical protein